MTFSTMTCWISIRFLLLFILGHHDFSQVKLVVFASQSQSQAKAQSQQFELQKTQETVLLVVGSANVDTFLTVARLPVEGENVMTLSDQHTSIDQPGGKGCTQAIAASKLFSGTDVALSNSSSRHFHPPVRKVAFLAQLGHDTAGQILLNALQEAKVDTSHVIQHLSSVTSKTNITPSTGRGYVFRTPSGSVSAVVSGGTNMDGWDTWKETWDIIGKQKSSVLSKKILLDQNISIDDLLEGVDCILLQREVPEEVNLLIASCAKHKERNILIFQDIGGEDRSISKEMLLLCDYITPNETELQRLVRRMGMKPVTHTDTDSISREENRIDRILAQVQFLQSQGAQNVLITRGSKGSILVCTDGTVHIQPAVRLPPVQVVDETGAGDCFRAAFAVALLEGRHDLDQCLKFANAAGSCSIEKYGAVASTPSRENVETRLQDDQLLDIPRGGEGTLDEDDGADADADADDSFPFLIGSRLNSMKDRPELWSHTEIPSLQTPRDFVRRQARIKGLTCVDFNYPQHFQDYWSPKEAKEALDEAGLVAGAVCLRYPSKFARGAMNHPEPSLRREAIEMTKEAAQVAMELGCDEVVVWSAYDGYDYPFQVDYDELWQQLVDAFQEICDAYPNIKFSLEYKPTDENTRFFTVPSTAAALLLVEEINRPNMGLTLDVGHMLMSGENPGQSIAQVGRRKKLFGIQLNDGFTRLAAEDGLMFGSVHPSMALEIMYQLRRVEFSGHFYFDTFPQRSDPILEAEYNIRQAKKFWAAGNAMDKRILKEVTKEHDAIGALELVNHAMRSL